MPGGQMNFDDHGVRCDGQRSLADPSEGKAQAAQAPTVQEVQEVQEVKEVQEVQEVREVRTVREAWVVQAARA